MSGLTRAVSAPAAVDVAPRYDLYQPVPLVRTNTRKYVVYPLPPTPQTYPLEEPFRQPKVVDWTELPNVVSVPPLFEHLK